MAKKKKRLTQNQFDRRIRILSLIVTLFIGLSVSATTIWVNLYNSTPRIKYQLKEGDLVKLEVLSNQIDALKKEFFNAKDNVDLIKLDAEIATMSLQEVAILDSYSVKIDPRWPPPDLSSTKAIHRSFLISKYGSRSSWVRMNGLPAVMFLAIFILTGWPLAPYLYKFFSKILLKWYQVDQS